MKKLFFLAAAAALAACSNDALVEAPSPEAPARIAFETYAPVSTRATGTGAENSPETTKHDLSDYHESFVVWGIHDTENWTDTNPLFKECKVSYANNAWTTAVERFWNRTKKYSFRAAAPFTDNAPKWVLNSSNELKIEDVELSGAMVSPADLSGVLKDKTQNGVTTKVADGASSLKDITNDIDYMIAHNVDNLDAPAADGKQNLEFDHILSRFNVTAMVKKDDNSKSEVKLTSVTFGNYVKNGSFAQDASNHTGTGVTDKGSLACWQLGTEKFAKNDVSAQCPTGNLSETKEAIYAGLVIPQNMAYENVNLNGTLNNASGSRSKIGGQTVTNDPSEPLINIQYTITTTDQAATDGASRTRADAVTYTETFNYTYNLAKAFGMDGTTGKDKIAFNEGWMYTLNIIIDLTATGPNRIQFVPEVYEWHEGGTGDIPQPQATN